MFIKQQCKQKEKTQSGGPSAQKLAFKILTNHVAHLLIKQTTVINQINFH